MDSALLTWEPSSMLEADGSTMESFKRLRITKSLKICSVMNSLWKHVSLTAEMGSNPRIQPYCGSDTSPEIRIQEEFDRRFTAPWTRLSKEPRYTWLTLIKSPKHALVGKFLLVVSKKLRVRGREFLIELSITLI